MSLQIFENRKRVIYKNREQALEYYKDRWLSACENEDKINCRRIYETIRDTSTEKIGDSYKKKRYIMNVFAHNKRSKCRKTFRLGSHEVLIIEKTFKGAGNWYELFLVDGSTDENDTFFTDGEHLIMKLQNIYQYDFERSLHNIMFYSHNSIAI